MQDNEYNAIKALISEAEYAINHQDKLKRHDQINKDAMTLAGASIGTSISIATLTAFNKTKANPLICGVTALSLPLTLTYGARKLSDHINKQVRSDEYKHLIRMAKKDLVLLENELQDKRISKERSEYLKDLLLRLKDALAKLANYLN